MKNNILDWALTLEESGIVGRDYSFSEEEKKIAQEKTEITNYITNFWGTATGKYKFRTKQILKEF